MAGELLILQEFCTQKNRTVKKPSGYRISISKKTVHAFSFQPERFSISIFNLCSFYRLCFSSNFETATKIFVQANKNNFEEEPTVVNTIPIIRIIKIIMQILG